MHILDFLPGHKKKKNLFILLNDEEAKKKKSNQNKTKIPDLKRVILVISFPT